MSRLTVAASTQALLRLVDGPGMLSKRVQIGKYIVDAVIIDAHPKVARWYGYESPSAMQGRYLSELHDPRGLALVRQYAVARKLGLPGVPDRVRHTNHLAQWHAALAAEAAGASDH